MSLWPRGKAPEAVCPKYEWGSGLDFQHWKRRKRRKMMGKEEKGREICCCQSPTEGSQDDTCSRDWAASRESEHTGQWTLQMWDCAGRKNLGCIGELWSGSWEEAGKCHDSVHMPHLNYPSIHPRTLGWLPSFSYCEQRCCEHACKNISRSCVWFFGVYIPKEKVDFLGCVLVHFWVFSGIPFLFSHSGYAVASSY